MLAFLSSLWAKIAGIGAAVLGVLAAVLWIRRDARRDALRDVTVQTQQRRLEDVEKAREVEHATAGLSDAEVRRRVRELAARGDGHGGV